MDLMHSVPCTLPVFSSTGASSSKDHQLTDHSSYEETLTKFNRAYLANCTNDNSVAEVNETEMFSGCVQASTLLQQSQMPFSCSDSLCDAASKAAHIAEADAAESIVAAMDPSIGVTVKDNTAVHRSPKPTDLSTFVFPSTNVGSRKHIRKFSKAFLRKAPTKFEKEHREYIEYEHCREARARKQPKNKVLPRSWFKKLIKDGVDSGRLLEGHTDEGARSFVSKHVVKKRIKKKVG
jgi:hypothetical protein